jgi:hypothetical protein
MTKIIRIVGCALLISTPALADSWDKLASYAAQQSKYYSGTVQSHRFCQADMGVCTTYITVYNPKGMWSLREVENINGAILYRFICKFNKNQDIRTCENFDTRETTREMFDMNGQWQEIK